MLFIFDILVLEEVDSNLYNNIKFAWINWHDY